MSSISRDEIVSRGRNNNSSGKVHINQSDVVTRPTEKSSKKRNGINKVISNVGYAGGNFIRSFDIYGAPVSINY